MESDKQSEQVEVSNQTAEISPARLADIPSEELNAPEQSDNIADDFASDVALAEFIQDLENAASVEPEKKYPSVADLYMLQVGAKSSNSSIKYYEQPQYWDEIDEYNDTCSSTPCTFSSLGSRLGQVGKADSYQPKTAGYTNFSDNGYARFADDSPNFSNWYKKSSKNKKSSKTSAYLDEDLNTSEILEDAIDAVGDRVDAIYDCVKSVDQQINDLYEKSLGVGDTVEELQEASRSQTMRGVEIEKRLKTLEINQLSMNNTLAEIVRAVQTIKENTSYLRWGDQTSD